MVGEDAPCAGSPIHRAAAVLSQWIARLPSGSFGMVIATGIVSIATHEELPGGLSVALGTVAEAAWAVLLILNGARVGLGHLVPPP